MKNWRLLIMYMSYQEGKSSLWDNSIYGYFRPKSVFFQNANTVEQVLIELQIGGI